MKWLTIVLVLESLACASRGAVKDGAGNAAERLGGECSWWLSEGGTDCVVETDRELRSRSLSTSGALAKERGYGKWRVKCGEKREVCGTEVECTCPFPVTSPDGGSAPTDPAR
jgi:hypothetical protein